MTTEGPREWSGRVYLSQNDGMSIHALTELLLRQMARAMAHTTPVPLAAFEVGMRPLHPNEWVAEAESLTVDATHVGWWKAVART